MTVEQQIANMQQASVEQTQASQALADEVAGKMGEIDSKLTEKQQSLDAQYQGFTAQIEAWKSDAPFYQKYEIGSSENSSTEGSGNYNLIKILKITEAYRAVSPWISFGWTGSNVVGIGQFCLLMQTHASYTGLQAMFSKRGGGDVRFFIDRTVQSSAYVYVAVKNTNKNNGEISVSLGSCIKLHVEPQGAMNIVNWLESNTSIEELDLIDITV